MNYKIILSENFKFKIADVTGEPAKLNSTKR